MLINARYCMQPNETYHKEIMLSNFEHDTRNVHKIGLLSIVQTKKQNNNNSKPE